MAGVRRGEVIEHVPDDAAFLAALRRLGRRVFLTTPLGVWETASHLRDYSIEMARALVAPWGGSVVVIPDAAGMPRWLGIEVGGEGP